MHRIHWSVLLVAGVILLGILAKFVLGREPAPEVAASNAIDCTLRYDSDCIFKMLDRDEVVKAGISREKLGRFLEEYVRPKLKGFKKSGPMVKGEGDSVSLSQLLEGPEGRPVKLSLRITPSDSGQTVSPYIVSVVFALFDTTRNRPLAGIDTIVYWNRCLTEEVPKLKAIGIDGMLRVGEKGTEYVTWDAYNAHLADLIEKKAKRP